MKKAAVFCGFLAIAMVFVTILDVTGGGYEAAEALEAPEALSAESLILIDAMTGQALYEQNADDERPMASTTKIMTALIALEQPALDWEFTVDALAIRVEGSSMGLKEGDVVTLRALAVGMLLSSGNDAANAAAVRIAGSIPAFVTMMNQRAAELGLSGTHFATPSGLDGEGHRSTARDMAALGRAALQNEAFAEICGEEHIRTAYGNPPYQRTLQNHNKLLSMAEGVLGIKTGFTKSAGRCLVSAMERDGITLICVTLSAPDDWNDHLLLYEYGFSGFEETALTPPETAWEIPVEGGAVPSVWAEVSGRATAMLFRGETEAVVAVAEMRPFLFAPLREGEVVGRVVYRVNGAEIAEQPIRLRESVLQKETGLLLRFWLWLTGRS